MIVALSNTHMYRQRCRSNHIGASTLFSHSIHCHPPDSSNSIHYHLLHYTPPKSPLAVSSPKRPIFVWFVRDVGKTMPLLKERARFTSAAAHFVGPRIILESALDQVILGTSKVRKHCDLLVLGRRKH
jgi:hypothetical protein